MHSGRVKDPSGAKQCRLVKDEFGTGIHVVYCTWDGSKWEVQAIRFDSEKFTVAEGKKWLEDHDWKAISFEEAAD